MSVCPKCQRTFHEATGYCPYDGTQMVDVLAPGTPAPIRPELVIDSRPGRDYDRLIGQTLDNRYRIETRVGEGGMGVVFRARHIVIEKSVAVKVLKREVARDQNVVRRFVQEARAASRIGHPNIIDVTDFGVTPDGMTYQVMEYLEGQTLAGLLREEDRLPLARALPIVAQLARALGAAHDKGIVHRDLKPENVFLLSRDGRQDFVKVVDFGIAKVQPASGGPEEPRLTRAGAVFGTPEYMAPEQAQGRSDADHRIDIYALGTIFDEMLTGTVPHRGETPMRTLAMQLLDPIRPPRQAAPDLVLSDALEAVIMRSLAKTRQQRYPSMQAMLEALAAAAADVQLEQPLSASASSLAGLGLDPDTIRERRGEDDIETLPVDSGTPRARAPSEGAADDTARDATGDVLFSGEPATERDGETGPVRPSSGPPSARARDSSPVEMAEVAPGRLTTHRPGQRRWATIAALLALTCGVGATIALIATQRGGEEMQPPGEQIAAATTGGDTQPETGGGAAAADLRGQVLPVRDAGAGVAARVSKGHTAGGRRLEGSTGRRAHARADAGNVDVPNEIDGRGPDIEIQIVTDPRGGRLIHDGIDGGPDGTNFRRPQGTVMNLECRKYDKNQRVVASGKIHIEFDGTSHLTVCRMRAMPRSKCLAELKNPLDDCPD